MKWSEGLNKLRGVVEDIDKRIDEGYAKSQEAYELIDKMLDAITPDNDTEIPA